MAGRVSRVLMMGPLAPFADVYAAELRRRGYTPLSTVNELRQVGRLSRWLEACGLSAADLSGEQVEGFLAWQRAGGRHRAGWSRPGWFASDSTPQIRGLISQYGRMGLVLVRRIFRGLTIADVEGRKARAAYDLWRTSRV